jgi:hypothetical protein
MAFVAQSERKGNAKYDSKPFSETPRKFANCFIVENGRAG